MAIMYSFIRKVKGDLTHKEGEKATCPQKQSLE